MNKTEEHNQNNKKTTSEPKPTTTATTKKCDDQERRGNLTVTGGVRPPTGLSGVEGRSQGQRK